MSITSGSRARRTVNGYRNRMDRIMSEIERNAREMRFDYNNRRDEMDDILEGVRNDFHNVLDVINVQQFEDA